MPAGFISKGSGALKDERKTKKVLIEELESLRQRVEDLESGSGDRELSEKMEKYELVLDSITDVVFQMDLDFNWTYVTPSVVKSRGHTPDEVLKQGIEEVMTPESINIVRQTLGEELAKEGMEGVDPKRTRVMELQVYHKDGSLVWVEVISTFLRDEEGKVVGLQGVSRNITERKEAQEETRRFKDQYKILFEADVDGILIRNMDGDLVRANPAACSLLRSTEEELIGTNVYEMVHSDDHDVIKRQLEEISDGRIFKGEGLVKRSDGSTFIGSATVSPVEYDDGPHMMTVLRDVTEIRQVEADLKESEEKLQSISRNSPNFILALDLDYNITFANRTLTGRPVEEIIGSNLLGYFSEETQQGFKDTVENIRKTGKQGKYEMSGEWSGDKNTVFETRMNPVYQEGEIVSFILSIMDITDREQAQRDLVESELQVRNLYEAVHSGIILQSADGTIKHANHIASEIFGMREDKITGKTSMDPAWQMVMEDGTLVSGEDHPSMITVRTGKPVINAVRGLFSGDPEKMRWLLINTVPVHDEETGDLKDVMITFNDITELKQVEKDLLRHYKLSDAFLEAMPCFAVLLKSDRTVVAANKIAKYMGGTIGHSCYGSIYGFEDPCWWCLAPKLLKTGEPQHTVVEALGVVWDAYWVPIEEDLYLHYAFDITERIHAEREKNRLEEQLQHAQKMESLGVLAGGIAHDFNNLLMGIVGNVGMARMKTSPEAPCYVYIDRIETAAERASELTNQMLAYSGRGKFLLRSINLTTLVEEMTHLLSTVMDKKVVLEMNLDKDIPAIEADPSQIQQVVMNLLTNASDALGGQSGFVAVSTGVITCDKSDFSGFHFGEDLADGEYVFIEVTDSGHGIDEKGLGSIFDPFYTTKEGGRGLGLSAVIGIIRGHQGAIDVTSRPDKGTTFKILFPAGERPPEKADEEKPVHTDYMGEGTILVVDDERAVLEVARSILAEFGFNVITASDGLEALEVYEEYADEISLVLMDLTMPNLGGFEAFSQLKNFHKDIKVILSSGFTKEDAVSEFSDSGLVDFIQKPYSPEKLMSTIRKALEG
jgi:PAS domain S-box-containing protein